MTPAIAQLLSAPAASKPFAAMRNRARSRAGNGTAVSLNECSKEPDDLSGMEPQGLGDDLRLATGKEMVDGADRRSAAGDELLDAGS